MSRIITLPDGTFGVQVKLVSGQVESSAESYHSIEDARAALARRVFSSPTPPEHTAKVVSLNAFKKSHPRRKK